MTRMGENMTNPEPVRLGRDLIEIGDRHRRDLGDLRELAESIDRIGLLHPIVVDDHHRLIAGHRRLRACGLLGWDEVPVTIVSTLTTAVALLEAERDENTCRKDPTITEKVALADRLLELEAPAAAERKGGRPPKDSPETGANFAPVSEDEMSRKAKVRAARGAGMSRPTYEKARKVIETATDRNAPPVVRDVAAEAVHEMDATGRVDGAYHKVMAAQHEELEATIERLTPEQRTAQLERAKYKHTYHRLASQYRGGLLQLDPDLVALILDEDDWRLVDQLAAQSGAWFQQLQAARPNHNNPLRVVGGR